MALVTGTRNSDKKKSYNRFLKLWSKNSQKIENLSTRILSINIIAIMILWLGVLYFSQYTDSLIEGEMQSISSKASIYAAAISEISASDTNEHTDINLDAVREFIARTKYSGGSNNIQLFNSDKKLVFDYLQLLGNNNAGNYHSRSKQHGNNNNNSSNLLQAHGNGKRTMAEVFSYSAADFLNLIPVRTKLPEYRSSQLQELMLQDINTTLTSGKSSERAWYLTQPGQSKRIMLTATAPIEINNRIVGIVLVTNDGSGIERNIDRIKVDVFKVFLGSLAITVFLSAYLSGLIGKPLQRLAIAAEKIRMGEGRKIDIPDMSGRDDAIGELSLALREMTQALWDRMDAIENFAADVAHELKNPLTSLRSAVETVSRIKNEESKKKLMNIIHDDVQRLNRLISDISNASRLDAELSREKIQNVDIVELLEHISTIYESPMNRSEGGNMVKNAIEIKITPPSAGKINVQAISGRLEQVITNLVNNALSFITDGSKVRIIVDATQEDTVHIRVENNGVGIPENKLDKIFERFYSQRPEHEDYGKHSGLGLSISKQIIESFGGKIWAENLKDREGNIKGAAFNITLNR